ncbi:Cathepsin_B [Hexamita inflata]|uniref:Cathepsin B n=1 Tax=Hexamita inflata TaxID=28002 RepID=A0AA86NP37_9EUKA|nr:Cathepsin B [Hexamita inflata]
MVLDIFLLTLGIYYLLTKIIVFYSNFKEFEGNFLGENGYIRIIRGVIECGIDDECFLTIV